MRYVAAYLLAVLAGNQTPDVAAVEKILSSVGVKFDQTLANKVISELSGKSIEQLIKDGSAKLATVPSGAAVAAAAPAAAGGAKKEEPKKEEKKQEKKKEESEEEDGDMGFGLFD